MVFLLERDGDFVRDAERVLQHVGPVGEARRDLAGRFEVQAVVVAQPVAVAAVLAQADAEQDVVCVVIAARQEVRVVRRDDRQSDVLREPEDAFVELRLSGRRVSLDLQIVPILEDLGVPARDLARAREIVCEQVRRDLTRHAGG